MSNPVSSRPRIRTRPRVGSWVAITAITAIGVLAATAVAEEPRMLRVVGVQPLDASAARAGGPRQGAVNEALYEAVSRVALELVDEYGPPMAPDGEGGEGGGDGASGAPVELPDGWLADALGKDMTPYARSFRIVDDQGSRPVLFPGETKATREYVVVVEATVDVDRVRTRLADKRIIAPPIEVSNEDGVEIEALGLRHWSAYEAFVAVLEGPGVKASEVRPLEFEAGRAVVFAVVRGSAEDVLARLLAAAPREFEITGAEIAATHDPEAEDTAPRIQIRLLWTPNPPEQG